MDFCRHERGQTLSVTETVEAGYTNVGLQEGSWARTTEGVTAYLGYRRYGPRLASTEEATWYLLPASKV